MTILLILNIGIGFFYAVLNEHTMPRLIRGYIPHCTMCTAFWASCIAGVFGVLFHGNNPEREVVELIVTVISATVTSKYLLK